MGKEWNAVEILKHSRHDWLNKLQLIKGNLALKKIDRVNEIIEEIVIHAKHESNLTNLNVPNLAAFLMMYNWQSKAITLEFEVLGDRKDLSFFDNEITSWCTYFLKQLEKVANQCGENHLSISIQISDSDVRFFFDFSGIIKDIELINSWLEDQKWHPTFKLNEKQISEEELLVVLKLCA